MAIKTAPLTHENYYVSQGLYPVAGVDEVGRGTMAGPVVACAVILPHNLTIEGVYDSKKISPKKRRLLAGQIKTSALAYAFGIVDVETIDKINILEASLMAMALAINGLELEPKVALIDGNKLPQGLPCVAHCIKQGDAASHTIAAASILAKVERDAIMEQLHQQYPQYGFDSHMGYGTKAHRVAVKEHGLCPVHRVSFKWKG